MAIDCVRTGILVDGMFVPRRMCYDTSDSLTPGFLVPLGTGEPDWKCTLQAMDAVYHHFKECTPACVTAEELKYMEAAPGVSLAPPVIEHGRPRSICMPPELT